CFFTEDPFLDEEVVNNTFPRKTVRVDGCKPQSNKNDSTFTWTNVMEKNRTLSADVENLVTEGVKDEPSVQAEGADGGDSNMDEYKFRESICGEEALKISLRNLTVYAVLFVGATSMCPNIILSSRCSKICMQSGIGF
ncbi:hypothetical protein MKW98_016823, partial [Papaver atlanticum]